MGLAWKCLHQELIILLDTEMQTYARTRRSKSSPTTVRCCNSGEMSSSRLSLRSKLSKRQDSLHRKLRRSKCSVMEGTVHTPSKRSCCRQQKTKDLGHYLSLVPQQPPSVMPAIAQEHNNKSLYRKWETKGISILAWGIHSQASPSQRMQPIAFKRGGRKQKPDVTTWSPHVRYTSANQISQMAQPASRASGWTQSKPKLPASNWPWDQSTTAPIILSEMEPIVYKADGSTPGPIAKQKCNY